MYLLSFRKAVKSAVKTEFANELTWQGELFFKFLFKKKKKGITGGQMLTADAGMLPHFSALG